MVHADLDHREEGDLFGLYQGIPLTEREQYGGGGLVMPESYPRIDAATLARWRRSSWSSPRRPAASWKRQYWRTA